MAENQDGQEQSEEPTSKRIQDAREKGQVPRSRELATFIMMIVTAAMLIATGDQIVRDMAAMIHDGFVIPREDLFNDKALTSRLGHLIYMGMMSVVPLMAVLTVVAVIANILLSGWNFSTKALAVKLEKLDPIRGMAKLFSMNGLVELLKAMGKFILISIVSFIILKGMIGDF